MQSAVSQLQLLHWPFWLPLTAPSVHVRAGPLLLKRIVHADDLPPPPILSQLMIEYLKGPLPLLSA